jgi:dual-specificity kinase
MVRVSHLIIRRCSTTLSHVLRLLDSFQDVRHAYIVSELLGMSLLDFLHSNHNVPFPRSHLQSFSKQLLSSTKCERSPRFPDLNSQDQSRPSQSECHTHRSQAGKYTVGRRRLQNGSSLSCTSLTTLDLSIYKLLQGSSAETRVLKSTRIRLIDFSSAVDGDRVHSGVSTTRHYRAPETVLGPFSRTVLTTYSFL